MVFSFSRDATASEAPDLSVVFFAIALTTDVPTISIVSSARIKTVSPILLNCIFLISESCF